MQRRHRAAHYRVWTLLAVLLPLTLLAALVLRHNGPLEAPAIQLTESRP